MRNCAAEKSKSEFECGALRGYRTTGKPTHDASAPALPKFLEAEIATRPTQLLAFNSPSVQGARIVTAKRDRDFQVVEAFVDVTYVFPLDSIRRTRRVLASLSVGGDFSRTNMRQRLVDQAQEFFVLMVNACREDMFPLVRTH